MRKIPVIIATAIFFIACNGNSSNSTTVPASQEIANGEQLFKINCAQCHKPNEELIGPALKNVAQRWKDKSLLYAFIKNSQEVISRDAYAKALFDKYNQSPMMPMPGLTNGDIDAILEYCDEADAKK